MFSLYGAPALSQFRLDQLMRQLQARSPKVRSVASRWVHFIDAVRELDASEIGVLEKLLTYGARDSHAGQPESQHTILVTPRLGTVSPWSSKATDIFKVCGLGAVNRVERGTEYSLQTDGALSRRRIGRPGSVAARSHDRIDLDRQLEPARVVSCGAAARPLANRAARGTGSSRTAASQSNSGASRFRRTKSITSRPPSARWRAIPPMWN